jgi:hypothetical protein
MRTLIAATFSCVLTARPLRRTEARRPAATKDGPWFGVRCRRRQARRPPSKSARARRAPTSPDAAAPEFAGAALKADVETIVGFARAAGNEQGDRQRPDVGPHLRLPIERQDRRVGVDQFRKAGITDVKTQAITQDEKSSLWLPLSWKVTLLGDQLSAPDRMTSCWNRRCRCRHRRSRRNADGSSRVRGHGQSGGAAAYRVKGKIAVAVDRATGYTCSSSVMPLVRARRTRQAWRGRRIQSRPTARQRAVARFQRLRQSVLQHRRPRRVCSLKRSSIAPQKRRHKCACAVDLQTQTYRGLKAINGVGVIHARRDEVIVLNAHVDGWFDGAGDNGDGLGVLIALARHFAKPANKPQRTIAFVASAGHHTPGINGPRSFLACQSGSREERDHARQHRARRQRNFSPARTTASEAIEKRG